MRKLSIGFVSCFLGCMIFMAPGQIHAQVEENKAPVAVEEAAQETEKPLVAVEATNTEEKSQEDLKSEAIVEEKVETNPAPAETFVESEEVQEAPKAETIGEEKTEVAPNPIESEEAQEETKIEAVEEPAPVDSEVSAPAEEGAESEEVPAPEENIVALELAKLAESDVLAAGENAEETRQAKDISNEVQSKYVALTEEGHETKGTVKPDDGEAIAWEVSFTSPKGTIAGDYFVIDLSENLSLKGIEPDHENEYPIEIDGKVVADGVRLDRSTIQYTFNEKIKDQRNVVVSIKGFAYIDKTKVPNNSPEEKISIKLGDKVDEHTINVQYGDTYYTEDKLNGMSQFTEFNPKTGEYTQVFYINPDSKTITTSNRNWATGKVAMFIDGITPDGSPSDVNYTEENTVVSIQKLPAGTKVPGAIIENPVKTDEKTVVKTVFRDGGIEITFAENGDQKLRHNNIDSPYIVTVKSTAAPSQTGNNVYSRATLYGDGTKFHIMDNNIVTTEGDTEAQGDKIGYFIEHHVYKTKVDGVLQEDRTFTLHSNKTEGYKFDTYFTSKNEIDDFKFVRVDTDKLVGNPKYSEDGSLARGKYEVGETKEVTYIYVRDIQHGSFQEHHIYQTVDEDGNIITEDTVTKDSKETTGFDETSYTTSKKDKEGNVVTSEKDSDGYKLISVEASGNSEKKSEVKFDSKGVETTGNYVNGEKLEVTYVYQKQVTTKGSFKEHHIYQTVDEDGKVISTDEKLKKDSESTGKESEEFTTQKKDEEGYTLVKVEGTEGTNFDQDGTAQKTNYKKGETQEVTYIYQKKEITKGSFQEHHIYITKDENGKEVSREVVDGTETSGKKDNTYTTSAKEKDGFEFVETQDPKENPSYDSKGAETTGNYVAGKKQEITYVYEKTVKKPEEKPKEDPKENPRTPDPKPNTNPGPKEPSQPIGGDPQDPNPVEEESKDPVSKEESSVQEPVEEVKEVEKSKVKEGAYQGQNQAPKQGPSDDSRAPQTFDPGVASYVSLAGLASGLMAYLESKKRKNK